PLLPGCDSGADHHDEPKPRRGARSFTRGKRLQSQFESRAGDSAFARKNRSPAAAAIQPAVRDSTDPGRVTGRAWPQETIAANSRRGMFLAQNRARRWRTVGNNSVTFSRENAR